MSTIQNLPEFRWCLNVKCRFGQVHDKGEQDLMVVCVECESESCFRHHLPRDEKKECKACVGALEQTTLARLANMKPCPRCGVLTEMIPLGCGRASCKKPVYDVQYICADSSPKQVPVDMGGLIFGDLSDKYRAYFQYDISLRSAERNMTIGVYQ